MSTRQRERGGESEGTSPSHTLHGVEVAEEGAEAPQKCWRVVGGTAYHNSSPGEITGGLEETLVSKTWWKDAFHVIRLWTLHSSPVRLQAVFFAKQQARHWNKSDLYAEAAHHAWIYFFMSIWARSFYSDGWCVLSLQASPVISLQS